MEIKRTSDPVVDAGAIAEARSWCGLGSDTSEDATLRLLIKACTQDVEDYLRLPLVNQAYRILADRDEVGMRPADADAYASTFDLVLPLPLANVSAVSSVKAYDVDGVSTTLAGTDYALDARCDDAALYLNTGVLPLPLRKTECLELAVTAGVGASSTSVPAKFKALILRLVAFDFEHRGDDVNDADRCKVLETGAANRVIRL